MRDVARLGFILVGLHLCFSGVSGVASGISFLRVGEFAWVVPVIQLVFVVLPGLFLMVFSRRFSLLVFPESSLPPAGIDLVGAGLAVVGVYLVVAGISAAISFFFLFLLFLGEPAAFGMSLGTAITGTSKALFGVVLFRYPQEVLRRLGRLDSTRAA